MTSIYLVDDHTIVREGLRALLEGGGYEVVGESADPTVALADLQRLRPDLLLLDLNLDRRSGLELLTELQRRSLPVRCIVLTMSAQPRNVAEALRLGAAGYLLKGSPTHASPWAAPSPTQLTPPPGPLPHPPACAPWPRAPAAARTTPLERPRRRRWTHQHTHQRTH